MISRLAKIAGVLLVFCAIYLLGSNAASAHSITPTPPVSHSYPVKPPPKTPECKTPPAKPVIPSKPVIPPKPPVVPPVVVPPALPVAPVAPVIPAAPVVPVTPVVPAAPAVAVAAPVAVVPVSGIGTSLQVTAPDLANTGLPVPPWVMALVAAGLIGLGVVLLRVARRVQLAC